MLIFEGATDWANGISSSSFKIKTSKIEKKFFFSIFEVRLQPKMGLY